MKYNLEQTVYCLVKKVPFGQVTTYAEVSRKCLSLNKDIKVSYIGLSRLIGKILNRNKNSFCSASSYQIPCHRVVRSDSSLGGFQKGENKKKFLLEQEGVVIKKNKVENFNEILFKY